MTLYLATIEFDIVVQAESDVEAEKLVREHARDEFINELWPVAPRKVTDIRIVPPEWREAIPWGATTDATVEKILGGTE